MLGGGDPKWPVNSPYDRPFSLHQSTTFSHNG